MEGTDMIRTRSRTAVWGTALGGLALTLALSACGGPTAPQPGDAPSGDAAEDTTSGIPDTSGILEAVEVDDELAGSLPDGLDGVLTVGSNVQSAPNNFYAADGSTVVGSDHDLITAIGTKLGLEVEYENQDFGSLITSLQSGRVDVTIAAMNDTAERQEAIDFVDYLTSGITIMVQKGNPAEITGPDTLCGKTIAVVTGTSQQTFAEETSAQCETDGEDSVEITVTDSDSQNQTQLRTGRIDAVVNDLPSAVYISATAQDGEAFEVVPGEVIDGAPYGIGVNKEQPELRDAIAAALDELIADGTYDEILEAWGIDSGAVTEAVVNGGV
jgi:polar amino acid transport system substrate-binding protein